MFTLIITAILFISILLILIIYKRFSVFNIAVYETKNADKIFDYQKSKLIFRIVPKIRSKLNAVLTMADPFLLIYKDELFLFYEEKSELNNGIIKAYKTDDLKVWHDLGVILSEPFHLSFPFIFKFEDGIYLMPETSESRNLCLYHFTDFPYGCTLNRNLMSGDDYVDSHILKHDDIFYLFTNNKNDELRLFYSIDLIKWTLHPKSPIVKGRKFSRSGGSIIEVNDKQYRVAQDNTYAYGNNFNVFEITRLSLTEYEESLVEENVIKKDQKWNREGGHHFNSIFFKDRYISVFDGKKRVSNFEKIAYPFFRIIQKFSNNKKSNQIKYDAKERNTFSIIIPLYNKADYIEKAIHSVMNQTYREFEIIVVNDGSTDNSLKNLQTMIYELRLPEEKIRIIDQKNQGVSTARNNAVKIAKNDYIAFLDADDWWEPVYLEEMNGLIEEYPKAGIYGSSYYKVKNKKNISAKIGVDKNFESGLINYCRVYAKTLYQPLWTGATIIKKSVFESENGFKPNLKLGEDFDLWVRVAIKYPVAFLNIPLAYYNQDVELQNRAVGARYYKPEQHMIFTNYGELNKNSDFRNLFETLAVYALVPYYLNNKNIKEVESILKDIHWKKSEFKYQLYYLILPKFVVKIWFWMLSEASKIKSKILK